MDKVKAWARRVDAKLQRYPRTRTAVGIFLLVMAVIGSLLPVLQGWMFFVAAVGVLGIEHPIIQWCLNGLRRFSLGRTALKRLGIDKAQNTPPTTPPAST